MTDPLSYAAAGVDIDATDRAKEAMAASLETSDPRVLNRIGAFASLFDASFPGYEHPVLVLKTEEPGSKQLLAIREGRIASLCEDMVHHLINDIIVMGAEPLSVQDAVICGSLEPEVITAIVDGVAKACRAQGCTLTGGETSIQPGVLPAGAYVLTSSIVGVAEKARIIDGSAIRPGDVVLSLPSSGLHTNGYTLVRALLDRDPSLAGRPVGKATFLEAILVAHRCYYKPLKGLFADVGLHGMAHITGGGIEGNLGRVLPSSVDAVIRLGALEVPEVFGVIRETGNIDDAEMLRTYNLGAGLLAVVAADAVDRVRAHLDTERCPATIIGEIVGSGTGAVRFDGRLAW